jgi:hypothetical protein
MNLYIIESVLYAYTDGMVCIAAENLNQCRELFIEEFVHDKWDNEKVQQFDEAIKSKEYKVLQVMNQEAGVVSYVYGGA